jgi:hypothetical protein
MQGLGRMRLESATVQENASEEQREEREEER